MNCRNPLQRAGGQPQSHSVVRRRLGRSGRRGNVCAALARELGRGTGSGRNADLFQAPACARGFMSRRRAHAHASVQIDIDLSSQTMTVHSGSGETYVWPISSGRPAIRRRAACSGRGRSTRWFIRPNTATRRCRTPSSSMANMRFTARLAVGNLGRPASHGCVRLSPGNAATLFAMVQRQGAEIRIVGSPFSDVARARTALRRPRSRLRRSAIRGRSINGRAIRSRAERAAAPLHDALIRAYPGRNSRAWVSRFLSV